MASFLIFNPLTSAKAGRDEDGAALLDLLCLSRKRGHQRLRISRAQEPGLFDAVSAWLARRGPGQPPQLSARRMAELWAEGFLIAPEELESRLAETGPELLAATAGIAGERIAAAICPEVAPLLRDGPSLPALPSGPDQGLLAHGFCALPRQISAADLAMLIAYYRRLGDDNWLELPRGSDLLRRTIHNDPAARRVIAALAPAVSALTGQALKPSYSLAAHYLEGSDLPSHTDREQCEFTLSLYLDYSPETESEICPWPLMVHAAQGDQPVHQQRGGGLLISGRTVPHSRPPLPPGHSAWMLFLHYVPENFSGPLD